jgi:hypothetical protein
MNTLLDCVSDNISDSALSVFGLDETGLNLVGEIHDHFLLTVQIHVASIVIIPGVTTEATFFPVGMTEDLIKAIDEKFESYNLALRGIVWWILNDDLLNHARTEYTQKVLKKP